MDDAGKLLIDWLPARDFVYDRPGFRKMLEVYKEIGLRICAPT